MQSHNEDLELFGDLLSCYDPSGEFDYLLLNTLRWIADSQNLKKAADFFLTLMKSNLDGHGDETRTTRPDLEGSPDIKARYNAIKRVSGRSLHERLSEAKEIAESTELTRSPNGV